LIDRADGPQRALHGVIAVWPNGATENSEKRI